MPITRTKCLPILSDKAGKMMLDITTARKKTEPNNPNSYLEAHCISNDCTQFYNEYFDFSLIRQTTSLPQKSDG
jgi:hypothetical protein